MNYIKLLIGVLTALSASSVLALGGRVVHVTDGDTLWVAIDGRNGKPMKLRLRDVDAPEICQAGGPEARAALQVRVLHRHVTFESKARDSYERTIADVSIEGDDVAGWLVSQGHGWSYGWKTMQGRYATEERSARAARRGIFAHAGAIEPRQFRKAHGPCSPDAVRPKAGWSARAAAHQR